MSRPRHDEVVLRRQAAAYTTWDEVTVELRYSAKNITSRDLWIRFSKEGYIVFIDTFISRPGGDQPDARIRFLQPPTLRPFWENRVVMLSHDQKEQVVVRVRCLHNKRRQEIQSPLQKGVWYPEKITFHIHEARFGFMETPSSMRIMNSLQPQYNSSGDIGRSIDWCTDLTKNKMLLTFPVNLENQLLRLYRLEIPFTRLTSLKQSDLGAYWGIIIHLDSPPRVYRQVSVKGTLNDKDTTWREHDTWFRSVDIVADTAALKRCAIALNKRPSIIDIGQWTTYQLLIKKDKSEELAYNKFKNMLQDWNINIIDSNDSLTVASPNTTTSTYIWTLLQQSHNRADDNHLPFRVRYQLEVCVSQGVFNEHNLGIDFVSKLVIMVQRDQECGSSKAQHLLEYAAQKGVRIFDPLSIFSDAEALGFSPHIKVPEYCGYMRKATITPTSMLLSTPTVEISNRVTRHYRQYADHFLRVQFTDEKTEGRISSTDNKTNDELYTRIFRVLTNGIKIGEYHFKFLAFGNSQFRENGAYFFCPTANLSCQQIRDWMGDFRSIQVPAKYAARLGQCFSTTRAIHTVRPNLKTLDDVVRHGHNFTDGVGKISGLLAAVIADQLDLKTGSLPPSAFQFRLGGCKGMLAVWDDVKSLDIWLRPSQQKFAATYEGLEIIRWSRFSPATLNRQIISVLSALGVEDGIFTSMLSTQLSEYQQSVTNQSLALKILSTYIDPNQMTTVIAAMIMDGFMTSREPFVMSILHLWRSWSIKALKEKARIMVTDGAFLLGVTDETGILKGHTHVPLSTVDAKAKVDMSILPEIFLQIPATSQAGEDVSDQYTVIQGLCLIGRNPSLHPGDIRVVMAVDVPKLYHLRDVVVFSQNGDQDVPSMCSGGDLDGDDFFVLWDKNLIPKTWTPAMDFRGSISKPKDSPVDVYDLMKFFVTYMKNDSLGKIANAHLAQSDRCHDGVFDPICTNLAMLHSSAVDYVKTGIPAKMEKRLAPRLWPHFMENKYRTKAQVYKSTGILGQLYDQVDDVGFQPQYENAFDIRILNAYTKHDGILGEARKLKTSYDAAMLRIMAQHDIMTEFEVWTTFVLSKPKVGSDYKVQEEMGLVADALKSRFRSSVIEWAGGKTFDVLAPFVTAMYQITQEEMALAIGQCHDETLLGGRMVKTRKMVPKSMPLMSFPWLFPEVLRRIATGASYDQQFADFGISVHEPDFKQSREPLETVANLIDIEDDIVVTDQGVVHRGEALDLFKKDILDEDGEFAQAWDDGLGLSQGHVPDRYVAYSHGARRQSLCDCSNSSDAINDRSIDPGSPDTTQSCSASDIAAEGTGVHLITLHSEEEREDSHEYADSGDEVAESTIPSKPTGNGNSNGTFKRETSDQHNQKHEDVLIDIMADENTISTTAPISKAYRTTLSNTPENLPPTPSASGCSDASSGNRSPKDLLEELFYEGGMSPSVKEEDEEEHDYEEVEIEIVESAAERIARMLAQ